MSASVKNCAISSLAFSWLSEPCTEFSPTLSAGRGVLGVGGAHDFAVAGHGVLAFQNLHHHRGGGHEFHQFAVERPLGVDFIEFLGLVFGHLDAALGDNAQAGVLDHGVDLAGQIAAGGVRLDDREGAFGHGSDFLGLVV